MNFYRARKLCYPFYLVTFDFSVEIEKETGMSTDRKPSVTKDPAIHAANMRMQSSIHAQLKRFGEENASLRMITRYLIEERKELVRKADEAAKRNQNLNSLIKIIRWRIGGSFDMERSDSTKTGV
mmetsp:Transcript_6802/g.23894  ORF Transcript_6802/g.23894 Transcript_6802/m.23894 type:complete len:125 (+) Transcript_6802:251-625(+)